MVGWSEAWQLYQASPPALLFLLLVTIVGGWKYVVEPRLNTLAATQATHADRWEDHVLSAQERDILLDHHDRAVTNLKGRVRALEQDFAVEHGYSPSAAADPVNDSASPSPPDDEGSDDLVGRGSGTVTDGGQAPRGDEGNIELDLDVHDGDVTVNVVRPGSTEDPQT